MVKVKPRCPWWRPASAGLVDVAGEGDGAELVMRAGGGVPMTYDVFDTAPLLYRDFCDLEEEEEEEGSDQAFRGFASRYGLLTAAAEQGELREPLAVWRTLRADLGQAVRLWDVTAAAAAAAAATGEVGAEGRGIEFDEQTAFLQLVGAAQSLGQGLWPRVSFEMVWDQAEGTTSAPGMAVAVTARDLRSALILQVVLGILEGRRAARCEACGRWFDRTPGETRKDRRLCSGPCRNRLARQRAKKKAA